MDWVLFFIQILYPLVMAGLAVGTVFYKSGKLVQTLETLQQTSEAEDAKLSSRLDGVERFLPDLVPRGGCDARHERFESLVLKKIDDLYHALEVIETKRDAAAAANDKRWNEIFQAVGRLQGQQNGRKT